MAQTEPESVKTLTLQMVLYYNFGVPWEIICLRKQVEQ